MDLVSYTRQLIDIESVTWNEGAVAQFVSDSLARMGFEVTTHAVSDKRFNVAARLGDPLVTFSSHLDTVPPFIPSSEDETRIHGRGSCDAKGIVAAQIAAANRLRDDGVRDFGMLYLVGEEDGSDGARVANELRNRNRYLINGEPTESHQAIATKGALRVLLEAKGMAAHSAYPELGESAIEKLLDVLQSIRQAKWPVDSRLGATTCNIGTISGGSRANVVADSAASELMFRTVTDAESVFEQVKQIVGSRADVKRGFTIPPVVTDVVEELAEVPTTVVRFGTDIPCLTKWGTPLLFGPGSIHDAHTAHEFIYKKDLEASVGVYVRMAKALLVKARME
jgi:acetylornithine deacetylase